MRKILLILLFMLTASVFTSCEKEEPEEWYNGKEKLWNPDIPLVPIINNTEKTN